MGAWPRRRARDPRLRPGPIIPYRYHGAWTKATRVALVVALAALLALVATSIAPPERAVVPPAPATVARPPADETAPAQGAPSNPAPSAPPSPVDPVPDRFEAPPETLRPSAIPPIAPAPTDRGDPGASGATAEPAPESAQPQSQTRPRPKPRPRAQTRRVAPGTAAPPAPFTLPQALRPTN